MYIYALYVMLFVVSVYGCYRSFIMFRVVKKQVIEKKKEAEKESLEEFRHRKADKIIDETLKDVQIEEKDLRQKEIDSFKDDQIVIELLKDVQIDERETVKKGSIFSITTEFNPLHNSYMSSCESMHGEPVDFCVSEFRVVKNEDIFNIINDLNQGYFFGRTVDVNTEGDTEVKD